MSKQKIIGLKQKQALLELDEKHLTAELQFQKRTKNIGVIMAIAGIILSFSFASINYGLTGMMLLIAIAGIILWVIMGIIARSTNKKLTDLITEIGKVKDEITKEEHC